MHPSDSDRGRSRRSRRSRHPAPRIDARDVDSRHTSAQMSLSPGIVDWRGVRPPRRKRLPSSSTTWRPARPPQGVSSALSSQVYDARSTDGGAAPGLAEHAVSESTIDNASVIVLMADAPAVALLGGSRSSGCRPQVPSRPQRCRRPEEARRTCRRPGRFRYPRLGLVRSSTRRSG